MPSNNSRHFAHALAVSVDDFVDHIVSRPFAVMAAHLFVGTFFMLIGPAVASAFISLAWLSVQFLVQFRPTCSRACGLLAASCFITALLAGSEQASKPAKTLFFELDPPSNGRSFNLTLDRSDGILAASDYFPVFLIREGMYARFSISAADGTGRLLSPPRYFELGPDDSFPMHASPQAAPAAAFAASNRRRLRGRMMRGFSMRGGTLPRGGLSRGTGAFTSPHRGSPSSLFRRPTSPVAHGTPVAHGVPVAQGFRPGVASHVGATGGWHSAHPVPAAHRVPSAHPAGPLGVHASPLMHHTTPIMAGLAMSHVLRHSGHRHSQALLNAQQMPASGDPGGPSPALVSSNAFYYGARALPKGTHVTTVPLAHHLSVMAAATARNAREGKARCDSRDACGVAVKQTLSAAFNHYVLTSAAMRTPPPSRLPLDRWPMTLRIQGFVMASKPPHALHAGGGGIGIGIGGGATPLTPPVPASVPAFAGLQPARPPGPHLGNILAYALRRMAYALWLFLAAAALVAVSADPDGRLMRLGTSIRPRDVESDVPPCVGGDGELIAVGTRVQTQWLPADGGDGSWFAGTVIAVYPGRMTATVEYDDGELWTGTLSRVYTLRADDDVEEAASSNMNSLGVGRSGTRRLPIAVGRMV